MRLKIFLKFVIRNSDVMERRFREKKITPDQCARIVTLRNDAKWSYRKFELQKCAINYLLLCVL